MIADSSVWIDWLRGRAHPVVERLDRQLRAGDVRLLPIVLQEVLQGAATPERFTAWNRAFDAVPMALTQDAAKTAVLAAGLYARCRWAGFTPRSANDCLIAASCIELGEPLLHLDRDFVTIARVEPGLRMVSESATKGKSKT